MPPPSSEEPLILIFSTPSCRLVYVYNTLQSNEQKDEFEAWVAHEYPPQWKEMQVLRKRPDVDGLMKIKLLRPWRA